MSSVKRGKRDNGGAHGHPPTSPYGDHWWVTPEVQVQVDSFTGLEPLYLLEDLFIVPFPRYGLWWMLEYRQGVYVWTHGPYDDEETARLAGYQLVE